MLLHDQQINIVPHFHYLDLKIQKYQWQHHLHQVTLVPMVSHAQKPHWISFWLSWPNTYNWAIDGTISIMWLWYWCQWDHSTKKGTLHIILIVLTLQIQWCHWQCNQHHMTPMLVTVISQEQKCHVELCFDYLYLINVLVLLTVPLVLCDADDHGKSVKWLKKSCQTLFWSTWPILLGCWCI